MFNSSRPHIARVQRYERRRAAVIKLIDKALNMAMLAVAIYALYIVLLIVTV